MEFQDIKTKVDYLEDRVITNFEKYFSYLVLEDFHEGGYNDRIADEFFYEEYFTRYEDDIINLLLFIGEQNNEEYIDFELRLIKMKRVIDNLLTKISKEDNDTPPQRQRRHCEFLLAQNLDKNNFVDLLHKQLIDNKLIDVSLDEFKKHFNGDWENKIQWFGTEIQITNLINSLIDKKFLDPETLHFKYKLITSHFINKKGNDFREKQLGSVYSEKWEDIPKDDVTHEIIYEISTHFKL